MNQRRGISVPLAVLALSVTLPACQALTPGGARDVRAGTRQDGGAKVTQTELQQDLQRFAAALAGSIADTSEPLIARQSASAATREAAMRLLLRYQSSALDIATEPAPEIALLDMAVFVGLSRSVYERHWMGVFGEDGRPTLEAWKQLEVELDEIESKILDDAQRQKLHTLVDTWIKENPDRTNVEAVRFSEFSEIAGKISAARAQEASGLFGTVKSATRAADEAILVAERMRFIATRLPFLLRLQARLGAAEVTSDSIERFESLGRSLPKIGDAKPLISDLTTLTVEGRKTTEEARGVLEELKPILAKLPPPEDLRRAFNAVDGLNSRTLLLLERVDKVLGRVDHMMPSETRAGNIADTVEHLTRRTAMYLVWIGAVWSALFWGGYCVAKILVAKREEHAHRRIRHGH